jgi:hypothetical protein
MKFIRLLVLVLAGSCAMPATTLAGTDSGFYVGAGVGQASVGDLDSDLGNVDFDGDDLGWKAFAGFNFGLIPFLDLAIEGGYVDFGKPDEGIIEIDANGWDVFGLVGFNIGPVGLFAKGGVISWDADASYGNSSASDDGTDPAYGIGARIKLWSIEARAEYEYFDADSADDASMLSASAVWTF